MMVVVVVAAVSSSDNMPLFFLFLSRFLLSTSGSPWIRCVFEAVLGRDSPASASWELGLQTYTNMPSWQGCSLPRRSCDCVNTMQRLRATDCQLLLLPPGLSSADMARLQFRLLQDSRITTLRVTSEAVIPGSQGDLRSPQHIFTGTLTSCRGKQERCLGQAGRRCLYFLQIPALSFPQYGLQS